MKTCGCCGWSESAHGAVLSSVPKNPPCGQFQPLSEPQCVMAECDRTVEPGQSFYCTFHAVNFGRQGESDV